MTVPLPQVRARHLVRAERRGSSGPIEVEADDGGRWLVKLRGAAQGPGALVAEIIVAELAEALGLRVPARAIATIDAAMTTADRNDELADLIARSQGENLGFALLAGARDATPADVAAIADDTAARVLWLDGLVVNVDRTAANPNVLVRGGEAWMIDHGAALPFQYAWAAVTEASPRRPTPARAPHLFADRAARMRAIDDALAAALPRAVLEAAAARVPDALLAALTTAPTADRLARMRAAYVAFLWKRLTAPRPFVIA